MPIQVGIALFNDVEELDAVGPYQVFGTAASISDEFRLCTISLGSDRLVRAVNGLHIAADWLITDAPALDLLVLPGGIGTRAVAGNSTAIEWIRETARHVRMTASICSGARLTLAAGLATGKRITTHHGVIEELRADGRAAEVLDDVRFIKDGNIVHAAGVSAGIDMALWLVGFLTNSPALARRVRREIEYDPAPPHLWEV